MKGGVTQLSLVFSVHVASLLVAQPAAVAQSCGPQWLPGEGIAGTQSTVFASTLWDPDGNGPATPKVVLGGRFLYAGDVASSRVVLFDPVLSTFTQLGSGLNGDVYALATGPNGELIVGGTFTQAGGVPASSIARWNGNAWSSIDAGISGSVEPAVLAMKRLGDGSLVVGGRFTSAGGVSASNIARWSGTTWTPLASGVNGEVFDLELLPGGDLVAGGAFLNAGGTSASYVARWNGITWSNLGNGVNGQVNALAAMPDGRLFAGGVFTTASGTPSNQIAVWDGSSWSAVGTGASNGVSHTTTAVIRDLLPLPNGNLIAGGRFSMAGGVAASRVARWNGTTWSNVGSGFDSRSLSSSVNEVFTLGLLPNEGILAGGSFDLAGSAEVSNVAKFDGSSWSRIGSGLQPITGAISSLSLLPNGDVIAAGSFRSLSGVPAASIARWNGIQWNPLGDGIVSNFGSNTVTVVLSNGDVVANGTFRAADGTLISGLARWNGTSWSALGTGAPQSVRALARTAEDHVIAAGQFSTAGGVAANNIAKWDGTNWTALGSGLGIPNSGSSITELAVLPNGDVVAGGSFTASPGSTIRNLARWNGTAWSAVGTSGTISPSALLVTSNGDLLSTGFPSTPSGFTSHVARWNGSTWTTIGPTIRFASALLQLVNGDLILAGDLASSTSTTGPRIARFDGSGWAALGGDIVGAQDYGLVQTPQGELIVGGFILRAGTQPSTHFARYSFTGIPTMSSVQPLSQSLVIGQSLMLTAAPSNGYSGVSVRWQRNGVDLIDGPGGASVTGGTVSGARLQLASPTKVSIATLSISNIQLSDAGSYTAIFTNNCGSVTSIPAIIAVTIPPCGRADIAGEGAAAGADGLLDNNDFVAFIQFFFDGDARADLGSEGAAPVADGLFDNNDFVVFIDAFFQGC
jgi:trimeric autotransporter adhesin